MVTATPELVGQVLICTRRRDLWRVESYDPGPPPCLWLNSFWDAPEPDGGWAAHDGTLVDYEAVTS